MDNKQIQKLLKGHVSNMEKKLNSLASQPNMDGSVIAIGRQAANALNSGMNPKALMNKMNELQSQLQEKVNNGM